MSDSHVVRMTAIITSAVLAFLLTSVLVIAANDRHSKTLRVEAIHACGDVAETYQDLCLTKVTG